MNRTKKPLQHINCELLLRSTKRVMTVRLFFIAQRVQLRRYCSSITNPPLSGSLQPRANFHHAHKGDLSIVVSCTCDCVWVLFLLSFWNANSLLQMSRAAHQSYRARMGAAYPAQPGVTRSLTAPMPQMKRTAVRPYAFSLHCSWKENVNTPLCLRQISWLQ